MGKYTQAEMEQALAEACEMVAAPLRTENKRLQARVQQLESAASEVIKHMERPSNELLKAIKDLQAALQEGSDG